jgi:hypothetical protein
MNEQCKATANLTTTRLFCHLPTPHPGLNHYDGIDRIWWQRAEAGSEPVLADGANL